jgi:hypothetical protein
MRNKVLSLSAAAEGATGLLLLAYPAIVTRLLFSAEISGAGTIMCRIAGIALIGLGVSCWPGSAVFQPLNGMLTYSTLAMVYLIVVGVRGEEVGLLLWPAVAAHAILVILLFRIRLKEEKSQTA